MEWKERQLSVKLETDIILSYDGTPTNKHTVQHMIDRYARLAGVHSINPHSLRHSHTSMLISLGINPLYIRDRLGHKDVQTTLQTYGHLYPSTDTLIGDAIVNVVDYNRPSENQHDHFSSNEYIQTEYRSVP